MATFKRFEDIKAWQKARRLTSKIYASLVLNRLPSEAHDTSLQTPDSRLRTPDSISSRASRSTPRSFASMGETLLLAPSFPHACCRQC